MAKDKFYIEPDYIPIAAEERASYSADSIDEHGCKVEYDVWYEGTKHSGWVCTAGSKNQAQLIARLLNEHFTTKEFPR